MAIETKTASLETFSVTIQVLMVGDKGMSLAAFCQLPEKWECIADEKMGIVRHSINGVDEWVICAGKNRLFRRRILRAAREGFEKKFVKLQAQATELKRTIREDRARCRDEVKNLMHNSKIYADKAQAVPFNERLLKQDECVIMAERKEKDAIIVKANLQTRVRAYKRELVAVEKDMEFGYGLLKNEERRVEYDKSLLATLPQIFIAV